MPTALLRAVGFFRHNHQALGEVAQLVRASGSYPLGRRFESDPRYHLHPLIPVNAMP